MKYFCDDVNRKYSAALTQHWSVWPDGFQIEKFLRDFQPRSAEFLGLLEKYTRRWLDLPETVDKAIAESRVRKILTPKTCEY